MLRWTSQEFLIFAAFFSYLWLCVVSYFQILREIDQVTILHTVDSPRHKVTPFIMDPYDTDKESPYDNLSEHTAKESLDGDTVSMRSQAPAAAADPVKSPIGSTIDVKTEWNYLVYFLPFLLLRYYKAHTYI